MRANVTKSGSNTSTNYDIHNSKRSATMMRMCMKKQLPLARARSGPLWGEMQGPAESDALTDVDDAEVDAAEGVETRARTRACGDASDDAEDAFAGEGEATLTRTHLGRPADADGGEATAGVDVVGVLTRNRFGVVVFCSCGAFLALAFLGVTLTDARNAARCKSSVSRWISVSCSPWATTSSCRCRCCRRGGDAVLSCLRGTHVTTWMMPMCVSLLHRECRRGLVLEPAGTLAMTRKMLLLIKARNRRPVRAWRWMHDRQMRTRAKP